MGTELLRNIRELWWQAFVKRRPDMVGLDSQIIQHPRTWEASGHTTSFTDALVEDTITHKRYRADHLIEDWVAKQREKQPDSWQNFSAEALSVTEMADFIDEYHLLSPDGNPLTKPKSFNLLFETAIGSVAGDKSTVYLRGETAQGIFSNFKNILDSSRVQLPFGVAQIGKSFRNEITTGQFVFRTLEFEQAEIEYFFNPETTAWQELFSSWKDEMGNFVTQSLGINEDNLRWREHSDTERSFYSRKTEDLEYRFPFGWKELWGLAYRTDYDLGRHMEFSGESLEYTDPQTGDRFIPHVIEPAAGINRLFLMILADAFWYDEARSRTVLKLKPALAPYKVAVFPLVKNKAEIVSAAKDIFHELSRDYSTAWDERGNIGKRYLAQDEIGTPYCVTIDYQTLEDQTVTVRDRDTANQERVPVKDLANSIKSMLE
jgi:glycyl-tRNA synthetase